MNYNAFQFMATIEWIDIHIQTKENTNVQTLSSIVDRYTSQNACIRLFSEGALPHQDTSTFVISLHNPENWQWADTIITAIDRVNPVESKRIEVLAIALDAYLKNESGNTSALAELAVKGFYNGLASPVSDNHQLGTKEAKSMAPMPVRRGISLLQQGHTIWIGSSQKNADGEIFQETDPIAQKIYVKTQGSAFYKNGEYTNTERAKCSARLEIILQFGKNAHGLDGKYNRPTRNWTTFRDYRFERLANRYFSFYNKNNLVAHIMHNRGHVMQEEMGGERGRTRRLRNRFHVKSVRNGELSRMVWNALRALTGRWGDAHSADLM
jgi:hypothetical protein